MAGDGSKAFLDTNIVLYVASADALKAARAEALIEAGGLISVQVLNEIANVARRKMALAWPEVHTLLDAVHGLLEIAPLTLETHRAGLALSERYGLSVYDAMIVAAALEGGCETLWSEDMQDGLVVSDRLMIRNPFRGEIRSGEKGA
jgi:predicted nucleic acid-binding protein